MAQPLDMAALAAPAQRMAEPAAEAFRLQAGKPTPFATPNTVAPDLKAMRLRDY